MLDIEIFIYDQVIALDVTGPMEVFTAANHICQLQGKPPAYRVFLSALTPGLIRLSSGAELYARESLTDLPPCDYFILPGSFITPEMIRDKPLVNRLTAKARASSKQVSVCTGTFLLAATGLLDNKSCTTHWHYAQQLAECFPTLKVNADAIYIQSGSVYSSAGVTAGIDLALALVEQDYGADLAMAVARSLVLYMRRPGGQSQFSEPMQLRHKTGERFNKLHDWLQENIRSALSVEQMADFCRMSPRHFARRFTDTVNITPAKYLEQLRLTKARELLETTNLSIEAVALDTGFGREERLRRTFLKILGVTPGLYRQHFMLQNPL